MMLASLLDSARSLLPAAADHLWQSTLFAAVAAAAALALRKAQARVRFALWLVASVKFLVPLALLIALGARLAPPRPIAPEQPTIVTTVIEAGQPFTAAPVVPGRAAFRPAQLLPYFGALWLAGALIVLCSWTVCWLRVRSAVRAATPRATGREVEELRRAEQLAGLARPIPFLVSSGTLEPGVCGVIHPVLLWPAGISDHLADAHLAAILAHEVCHVRRRDNLAALLHMFVEAVFWFHPLVWWLGARLVEERERACDEAVLRLGSAPGDYAESILKACQFSVESPLACVAGVSGSNLKRRIVRIMNRQLGTHLSLAGKLALAALAAAAVVAPVLAGLFNPTQIQAQGQALAAVVPDGFSTPTVKPNHSGEGNMQFDVSPAGLNLTNVTVRQLIEMAYGIRGYQLSGGPDWLDSERFDVQAKPSGPVAEGAQRETAIVMSKQKLDDESVAIREKDGLPPMLEFHGAPVSNMHIGIANAQVQATLQSMLKSQFHLEIRQAPQNLPVYELAVSENGVKFTPLPAEDEHSAANKLIAERTMFRISKDQLSLAGAGVHGLAEQLGQMLDRPVVDKTGLTGRYNLDLHWQPSDDLAGNISAALEDQLGLRLERSQAPMNTISIQHIELPAAN